MFFKAALCAGFLFLIGFSLPAIAQTTQASTGDPAVDRYIGTAFSLSVESSQLVDAGHARDAEDKARESLKFARLAMQKKPDSLQARLSVCNGLDRLSYAKFVEDPVRNIDEVIAIADEGLRLQDTVPDDTQQKYSLMRGGVFYQSKAQRLMSQTSDGTHI